MDSERELENLRGELSESVIALTQEILARVRGNSAQVLIRRYCVGKSFKEIVFEMHYSQSHIFRLYQQGVQQFNSAETKARNSLANHVPDKFKKVAPIQGVLGGAQEMTLINEAGLYKLIMRSKLPNAEKKTRR